jgi:arylsulfatase A
MPTMNRRRFLQTAAAGACALALPCWSLARAQDGPPNIVVILADDLGYADLGCYGAPRIATPALDAMAREGLRFTSFYSCAAVCTPARAGLLTGCYPARVGLAQGVLFPNATIGLNPAEITVARLLKQRGYATACIGKWHLGDASPFLPTRHGFDTYFGIPYSNDMRVRRGEHLGAPMMRDEQIVEHPTNLLTVTERFTEAAVDFIQAKAQQPFFLYLAHSMPHVPIEVSERFAGKSPAGIYGDAVGAVDWSTGEVLSALAASGVSENTLVLFTSDNGPWLQRKERGGSAGALRAGKGTIYEGGMRVPCIARWPGQIPAGRTSDEVASLLDILPTAASLAGAAPPAGHIIDGKDLGDLLRHPDATRSPHEAFFYYAPTTGELAAVREGPWKLVLGAPPRPGALYNLADDVGEQQDLTAAHPQVVERLGARVAAHRAEMQQHRRPVGSVARSDAAAATRPARGANDR